MFRVSDRFFFDNTFVLLTITSFAKGDGDDPTRLTRQYLTACLASTQFIPPRKMLKFLQDKPDLTEDMKVRLKVTERYYENSQLAWVNVRLQLFSYFVY